MNTVTDDGKSFSIPSSLIWDGQPNTWTGSYQENTNLKSTIVGYGDGDLGCVSSLANSLIHYAAARGVKATDLAAGEASYKSARGTKTTDMTARAQQSLYLAKELLDREWAKFRDDIGVAVADHNTNLPRLWNTKLVLPDGTMANGQGKVLSASRYTGKMPNGDEVKNGVAFVDIRSNYKSDPMYQEALSYYEKDGNTDNYYFTLHRFWHAGDIMMALGYMSELYPDLTPDSSEGDLEVTPSDVTVKVGETETLKPNVDGCTFESADSSVATVSPDGTVTGVAEGSTTITVTSPDGKTATVTVTVTADATTTTTTATTTATTTTTSGTATTTSGDTTTKGPNSDLIGDVNLDGKVDLLDAISLNKYLAGQVTLGDQAMRNANCNQADGSATVKEDDGASLVNYVIMLIDKLPE